MICSKVYNINQEEIMLELDQLDMFDYAVIYMIDSLLLIQNLKLQLLQPQLPSWNLS